jgi:rhomboid protease GluP
LTSRVADAMIAKRQMEIPTVLTMAFLAAAWIAEAICLKDARWRTPILTLTVCGLLLSCLIAQLSFPGLLIFFERDTTRIVAGERWRIVSALFFQDGWIIGGLTNIVTLFWIGNVVEQVQSRWYWLLVSIAGALAGECFALRWQPVGAGNSVATCSLAGSLIMNRPFSRVPTLSKALRAGAMVVACFLVAARNLHGVAGMAGILLSVLVSDRLRRA